MKKTSKINEVLDGDEVESYTILINDTKEGFVVKIARTEKEKYFFIFCRGEEGMQNYRRLECITVDRPDNRQIKDIVSRFVDISKTIIM